MPSKFRQRLAEKKQLIGTMQMYGLPEITEMISQLGFDYIWIDLEHAPIDIYTAQTLLQSFRNNCLSLIRIPEKDFIWAKRVLEIGVDVVVFPQVKTVEDVKEAIRACKYPPIGERGVGAARAQNYGLNFQEYLQAANEETAIMIQVEHIDAVNTIEELIAFTEVDSVVIGPYDMSASMGIPGQVTHPEVLAAIETVKLACQKNKTPIGIFTNDAATANNYLKQQHFDFVALSIDMNLLRAAAQNALSLALG